MPKGKSVEKERQAEAITEAGTLRVTGMPDRVWASVEFPYKIDEYRSIKINAGMASDVRPEENSKDAFKRVWAEIEGQIKTKKAELSKGTSK